MISSEPPAPTRPAADSTSSRPRYKHSHSSSTSSRRRVPRSDSSDFLSDRATSQLIRRVLCPQQGPDRGRTTPPPPIDELLPPLTSRNDVDLQLYAIIAIVLRDFVQTWYNKITPDEAFVAEIVQVIAHCTRALEQRLRKVDVESLLFDELPDLFDKHVQAYRASRRPLVRPPIEADGREIYHSLCPLPYLSPIPRIDKPETASEQAANEVAYRQLLVQGVLAVLLPTEDLENECLTSLIGQILSELIIGGVVVKKASEPWMIWTGLTILADVIARRGQQGSSSSSGPALKGTGRAPSGPRGFSIPGLLWSFVHYIFALMGLLRVFLTTLTMSRSLPPRGHQLSPQKEGGGRSEQTPILAFAIWPMISDLIGMDRRMPWLSGSLSMLQWLAIGGPGHVAGPDGIIDR
ncbi:hypothetical protein M406DRAFT_35868 [Cryphonectria parasitica EP155]|uniref:PXA domain-containing protein n=1 Tax=Cryphonectria parasitica (strain ATCC 38755 / EP155) TaxID=660469 RepID=A0A9P4YBV9_CRYP1|nr:uncharacterized protein M406DRAFT_35868 [Cryphonectria parasitica EP155]KAF3770488.1 hypothetical protein M406DRAFT_35868 [Cryphonectria parasitica EP155]